MCYCLVCVFIHNRLSSVNVEVQYKVEPDEGLSHVVRAWIQRVKSHHYQHGLHASTPSQLDIFA